MGSFERSVFGVGGGPRSTYSKPEEFMRIPIFTLSMALFVAGCNPTGPTGSATAPKDTGGSGATTVHKPVVPDNTAVAPDNTTTAPNNTATAPNNTTTAPGNTATASGNTATGSSNTGTAPDNTAVNQRDANANTKTPIDQKENQADIDVTAKIRQRVLDVKDLSIDARNAKIITADGKVTLRGPVKSEEERKALEKAAVDVAGEGNVDNQLEVSATGGTVR